MYQDDTAFLSSILTKMCPMLTKKAPKNTGRKGFIPIS